jgi:hypothetical protein
MKFEWKYLDDHNGHEHLNDTYFGNPVNLTIPRGLCETSLASYWGVLKLVLTDSLGQKAIVKKVILPNFSSTLQTILFS